MQWSCEAECSNGHERSEVGVIGGQSALRLNAEPAWRILRILFKVEPNGRVGKLS